MGEVFGTGKEADEGTAVAGDVIPDGSAEGRKAGLQRVEDGALGDRRRNVEFHISVHLGDGPEMHGKSYLNHASVCTSTESTGGRLEAMAVQLSPESDEA